MTLQEEFRQYDIEYTMRVKEEKGEKRGISIGEDRIISLYSWLYENARDDDVKKATSDPEYRTKLFEEYEKANAPV